MKKGFLKRSVAVMTAVTLMFTLLVTFPSVNAESLKNTTLKLYDCNSEQYFMPVAKTKYNGAVIQFDVIDFTSSGGWFTVQKGRPNTGFSYNETIIFTPTVMQALGTANNTFHFYNADGTDTGGPATGGIAVATPSQNTTFKFEFLANGALNIFWAAIGTPLVLRFTAPAGSFGAVGPGNAGIQCGWGVAKLDIDNFSIKEVTGANVYTTDFETAFIESGINMEIATNANHEYLNIDNSIGDGSKYIKLNDCNSEQYFMPTAQTQNSGAIIQFDVIDFTSTGGWFTVQKGRASTGFSFDETIIFTPTVMQALGTANTTFHFFTADGTDTGGNGIAVNTPTKNTTFKFEFLANGALNIFWAPIGQPLVLRYTAPAGSFGAVGPGNAGVQCGYGVANFYLDNFSIKEITGETVFSSGFETDIITSGVNQNVATNITYRYGYGFADPVGDGTSYMAFDECSDREYIMPTTKTTNSGVVIQFDLINFESTGGWFAVLKGRANTGFTTDDILLFTPTAMASNATNTTFNFFKADGTDMGGNSIALDTPSKNTTFKFEFLANGALNIFWAPIGQPLVLRYTAPAGSFSSVGPGNAGVEAGYGVKSFAIDNLEVGEVDETVIYTTDFETDLITDGVDKDVDVAHTFKYLNRSFISFDGYNVSTEEALTNIVPGTTVAQCKNKILPLGVSAIFADGEDVLSDTEIVKTGTNATITLNGVEVLYTIVIFGDVNSDGQIALGDLATMKNKILQAQVLTASELTAGDVTINGSITISDLLKLKKHLLEIEFITQS